MNSGSGWCSWKRTPEQLTASRTDNHAAILVSTASLLGLDTIIVPSSLEESELGMAWGSHPLTDPLLSSDWTAVFYDETAARTRKLAFIAESRIGLDQLRVCNRHSDYNCGSCEKCLRTMVTMDVLGAVSAALPRFYPRMLRAIKLWNQPQHGFWQSILELARQRGRKDIAGEVQRLLGDYRRREWLRNLDARYLGGSLLRLKRRLWPLAQRPAGAASFLAGAPGCNAQRTDYADSGEMDTKVSPVRVIAWRPDPALLIAACMLFPSLASAEQVLEYLFEDPSATIAVDTSGNNLDGTFMGSSIHIAPGLPGHGNGIVLNGVDDFINVGDHDILDFSDSYTLMAWINYLPTDEFRAELMEKGGAYWLNVRLHERDGSDYETGAGRRFLRPV